MDERIEGPVDEVEYKWGRGCGCAVLIVLVPLLILAIWGLSTVRGP